MRLTMVSLRILILILTLYGLLILRNVGISLREARQELELQYAALECLRVENTLLRQRVEETGEKEKWECIARQQLGLVSPDEIVIYNLGE